MFIKLPVATFEVIAVIDGRLGDVEKLAEAIHFALDVDRNSPDYGTFFDLISGACCQLYELAIQIGSDVLIMSAANRYKQGHRIPSWVGVIAGDYHYNNSGPVGFANENLDAGYRKQGYEARRILDELLARDWANMFSAIAPLSGIDFDEGGVMGLQVGPQGAQLMVGDCNVGGRGIFWSVDPKRGIRLAGVQPQGDAVWDIDDEVERGRYPEMISIDDFAAEILHHADKFTVERSLEDAIRLPPYGSGQNKKALFVALVAKDWSAAKAILISDEHCPRDLAEDWVHRAQNYLRSAEMREQLKRWVDAH